MLKGLEVNYASDLPEFKGGMDCFRQTASTILKMTECLDFNVAQAARTNLNLYSIM